MLRQQEQYILSIKSMLERTLFDQHINAIKMKYQIITQPTPATATTLTHNAQSPFITPARPNKHNISQTKGRQSPAAQTQHSFREGSHTNRHQKEQIVQQRQVCLSARNRITGSNDIEVFISEKQNILKQRMEQNERILMKSKELRDRESRHNSHQKEPLPNQQPLKSNKHNQENACSLTPTQHKPTQLIKAETVSAITKLRLQEANKKARKLFAQKINQAIDQSLQSKELCLFNEKKQQATRQEKGSAKLASGGKAEVENMEQNKLKLVTVFENTSKIQERIKALLSSH